MMIYYLIDIDDHVGYVGPSRRNHWMDGIVVLALALSPPLVVVVLAPSHDLVVVVVGCGGFVVVGWGYCDDVVVVDYDRLVVVVDYDHLVVAVVGVVDLDLGVGLDYGFVVVGD